MNSDLPIPASAALARLDSALSCLSSPDKRRVADNALCATPSNTTLILTLELDIVQF
jgi:hypothetical protein